MYRRDCKEVVPYTKGTYGDRRLILTTEAKHIINNALFYSKRYGCDIEDAFQEAVIGIMTAVDKYDKDNPSIYGSYASIWMRQIIERNLPLGERNFRLPTHYKQPLLPVVAFLKDLDANFYGTDEDRLCDGYVEFW